MRRSLTLAGLGGLLAAAVLHAPAAQADELTYLQLLNMRGLTIWDAGQAVRFGWAICDTLNYYNGTEVSEAVYQITDASVPDRATAAIWVVSAVEGLCPWHDHRKGALT